MRTARTRVPESSATVGFAPVPRSRRPQAERDRIQTAAAAIAVQSTTTFGTPAVARPASVTSAGLAALGGEKAETHTISPPLTTLAIASVATSGGTPRTATPTPFTAPPASPARQAPRQPSGGGASAPPARAPPSRAPTPAPPPPPQAR